MTNLLRPSAALPDDPHWHRDAIIYELHIRAFSDSNDDGIGDLAGLIDKLDYVADLGVTAIWLLPFYPSPLRDGGYDIADYTGIHDSYGTRRDFARLLREAHRRGIRVITELVLNHTSVEHPWFQRARRSAPGSKYREFYVWRDTPSAYLDARVIFKDFETSNWTWDPLAKAYYWHRFYSHQPDLNFDNPAVHEALFEVVDFWMDMGVDGLRLDAVPYLYEREQTICENLPETHAFLRELRAHVDGKYKNRILLAEANQWPADAAAYFGKGDECHMNFHFPLMPRMFMALELEDSFPIINILKQTPPLPEGCQWATFLRNHDELTLEMVTDEDRDTMWRAYASEHTARINLGIRRRLAPLLRVRRKIELLNALLLSLPGSPVIYYGDEIGMGDNIYLGDRDGVRTPMQWSSDRNAGFSRANPQKLYLPTIIDPEFHFQAVNVEAQQQNPTSLLWWMKRLIAKRKEHPVFGRGSVEFVSSNNTRVLAFVREYAGEAILVVANLSRFVQCASIDLSRFEGRGLREIFGRTRFPVVGREPYFLSLAPHTFFWLAFEVEAGHSDSHAPETLLETRGSWRSIFESPSRELSRALFRYVSERRWFRGKAKRHKSAEVLDVIHPDNPELPVSIALLGVDFEDGASQTYVLPVGFEPAAGAASGSVAPGFVMARLRVKPEGDGELQEGVLYDALGTAACPELLLRCMRGRRTLAGQRGQMVGSAFKALRDLTPDADLTVRPSQAEQSNSNVIYGSEFMLKIFRQLDEGSNPEYEMGRFLSQHEFHAASRLGGVLEYRKPGSESSTVGALFEFVPNQGDAWKLTLDALDRFFDRAMSQARLPTPTRAAGVSLLELARLPPAEGVRDAVGPYLERVHLLGRRTAELHTVLASEPDEPAFRPEPFDAMHQQSLYQSVHVLAERTWVNLKSQERGLASPALELVRELLERQAEVERLAALVKSRRIEVDRIRVHGDYHLGQVLWTGEDFVIVDFEGEPNRPLSQRRFKRCPLRDVAGMVRSFHYAAASALQSGRPRAEDLPTLELWASAWVDWVSAEYLTGYLSLAQGRPFVPRATEDIAMLLDFYTLEKCIYEVGYELDNRPDWLSIPVRALIAMLPQRA